MKLKSPVGLHPFLLALSPVLFLYSRNLGLLGFQEFLFSLASLFLLVCVSAFGMALLVRSRQKRTLMLSCLIICLFAYSNMVSFLILHFLPEIPRSSVFFLIAWALIPTAALLFIRRLDKSLPAINKIINVAAVCLISFNVFQIAAFIPDAFKLYRHSFKHSSELPAAAGQTQSHPNIYLILLDQHVGEDCLQKYGFKDFQLNDKLQSRGFYVADQSRSNYWATHVSLPSILNYDYFDEHPEIGIKHESVYHLKWLRRNNQAFEFLKQQGYLTVQCRSDFLHGYDDVLADVQLTHFPWYLGQLPREILSNTPFFTIISRLVSAESPPDKRDLHVTLVRRSILTAIEKTRQMAHFKQQPFVLFTHIVCPHGPHSFDENGNYPQPSGSLNAMPVSYCNPGSEKKVRDYLARMQYIDNCIVELVDDILENSETPPVIVICSDHGNRYKIQSGSPIEDAAPELFSIINALYLPRCDYDSVLYPAISPVNTFRVIFNHYFGTDYPLLPDKSFYPGGKEYRDVTSYTRDNQTASNQPETHNIESD